MQTVELFESEQGVYHVIKSGLNQTVLGDPKNVEFNVTAKCGHSMHLRNGDVHAVEGPVESSVICTICALAATPFEVTDTDGEIAEFKQKLRA